MKIKTIRSLNPISILAAGFAFMLLLGLFAFTSTALYAAPIQDPGNTSNNTTSNTPDDARTENTKKTNPGSTDADTSNGKQCGKGDTTVKTKFDFGCLGNDYKPKDPDAVLNPITDLAFAFVRFLSTGVGIVIIASVIVAGIQYSTSEGSPEATQQAKNRIQSAFVGLIIYIFAFSLIQYLVPGGLFSS